MFFALPDFQNFKKDKTVAEPFFQKKIIVKTHVGFFLESTKFIASDQVNFLFFNCKLNY